MCYFWRNNFVVVVHNFDEKPHEINLKIKKDEKWWINLLENERIERKEDGTHTVLLESFGYKWFRVGDLDHIIRQSREIKNEVI